VGPRRWWWRPAPDRVARGPRETSLRHALWLSGISVAWSGVVGAIAVVQAVSSGSVSLLGFGADAAIDAAASVALIWRFRIEAGDPARATEVEHRAERILGYVLLGAAAIVGGGAVRSLVLDAEVEQSGSAVLILVASLVVLPPLALAKRRVALALGSNALRADSFLTGAAAVLAVVSLAGLFAATTLGLHWADALGALVIAGFIAREGLGSVRVSGEGPDEFRL
jgi:divalent metal cation (Fe/Co/Zn/Cd) transporter